MIERGLKSAHFIAVSLYYIDPGRVSSRWECVFVPGEHHASTFSGLPGS